MRNQPSPASGRFCGRRSHKKTEGQHVAIRRAQAFYDTCAGISVHIFEGELIVGVVGEFRKCGILTPEFSWLWVDREMDDFDKRSQDPYVMTDEQRAFVREKIFPYWKGKSLEEAFLARVPEETRKIAVDTGVIDNDSKWRQAVGEISAGLSGCSVCERLWRDHQRGQGKDRSAE